MRGGIYLNKGKGSRYIVKYPGIFKRFNDLSAAERFLTGVRFKADEGILDPRDYRKENPLGFENLAEKWLEMRQDAKTYPAMRNHIGYATSYFGQRNIKDIQYGELEDFFKSPVLQHLSDKTKWNIRTTLHAFWKWVARRHRQDKVRFEMPEFPQVPFKLAFRTTIGLDIQDAILDDIKDHASYRAWLACYLLATYPKIRPGELRSIKEKDIDLELGIIRIRHPKSPKPEDSKEVKLLDNDIALFRELRAGFPEQYFCHHDRSGHGRNFGQRWGINYLNAKIWKPACKRLGVDVSLYPGTKHSTIRGLRKYLRPDEIRKGTGIVSNKAFERYFQTEYEDELKLYEARARLRGDTKVKPISGQSKEDNTPKL